MGETDLMEFVFDYCFTGSAVAHKLTNLVGTARKIGMGAFCGLC